MADHEVYMANVRLVDTDSPRRSTVQATSQGATTATPFLPVSPAVPAGRDQQHRHGSPPFAVSGSACWFFFFKQKTAYEIGLGIPAEPLFRSSSANMRRAIPLILRLLMN